MASFAVFAFALIIIFNLAVIAWDTAYDTLFWGNVAHGTITVSIQIATIGGNSVFDC